MPFNPIGIICGVFIFVIIILIIVIVIKLNKNTADSELYKAKNDNSYRKAIYNNLSTSAKPYINDILKKVDEINHMIAKNNIDYSQARYDAMKSILDAANQAEERIKWCWNNSNFNKDFSFYIGLHYSSHLLGKAIKLEQFKVRDTFVKYKNKRDQESKHIDELKRKQKSASKYQKGEIGQEIATCCKVHKQLSVLTSQIGEINSNYLKRATQQFIETARRRDYIASHFGKRGENWKKRMHMRALLHNK